MVLAILQARMSSSRLPGKVLKPLLGVPMILRQIERVQRATGIDHLLVATSTDTSDDELADVMRSHGVSVFRGPLDDVLGRFVLAATPHRPEWVLRLTADCPLADPAVIDRVIDEVKGSGKDFGSNAVKHTFPNGLEAELVRFALLVQLDASPRTNAEREHVTYALYRNAGEYPVHSVEHERDLSHHRWTVDEPRDFALVEAVYAALHSSNPWFGMDDVLRFLDGRPDVRALNADIARNAGLAKSLARESPVDLPDRST
jgi:spore coat polysaccharide biosynthesis protein SpsF